MKFTLPLKSLSVATLVLGLVVGCATEPRQVAAPAAPATTTPSPAVMQALDTARTAVKQAKSLDWIWRDTEQFLKDAETAAAAGEEAKAIKLANEATTEANSAINQYYIEKSKPMLAQLQARRNLNSAQKTTLQTGASALANAEGKKAYDALSSLMTN